MESAGVPRTTGQVMFIERAAQRLRSDFAGTFDTETIERCIADSQDILQQRANFATWLRHLAGGRGDVFSGGTDPGVARNQAAVALRLVSAAAGTS